MVAYICHKEFIVLGVNYRYETFIRLKEDYSHIRFFDTPKYLNVIYTAYRRETIVPIVIGVYPKLVDFSLFGAN